MTENNFLSLRPELEGEISVFETMRSYDGYIPCLEEHLERLQESAKTLGLAFNYDKKEIGQKLSETIEKFGNKNCLLRPTLFKEKIHFFILPLHVPDARFYEEGVTITTAAERLAPIPSAPVGAKSTWYGPQALTHITHHAPSFEVLFLDTLGFVGELRVNNLFIIKKGILKTPPAIHILNGVTRRFVLGAAKAIPLAAQETFITRHEIFNADECFITNSVVEILPVKSLDGRLIGGGKAGVFTQRLRESYQKNIKNSLERVKNA